VAHPVENNFLPEDVVADPVGPHLQAPLAHPLAFELLDLGRGTSGIRFEAPDAVEDLLLTPNPRKS